MAHYGKAHIPIATERTVERRITAFLKEYESLRKKRRETKLKVFREKLPTTMPLWPDDVEEVMLASKKGKTAAEVAGISTSSIV